MSIAPRLPARTSWAWARWLPFLAWVSMVVSLFHPGSAGFAWVSRQPSGDRLAHVLLVGPAALLLDLALSWRRVRLGGCGMPLAWLVVAAGMTAEEVSQLWMPGRNFDLGDLAANYIGITAAWAASAWLSGPRVFPAAGETIPPEVGDKLPMAT